MEIPTCSKSVRYCLSISNSLLIRLKPACSYSKRTSIKSCNVLTPAFFFNLCGVKPQLHLFLGFTQMKQLLFEGINSVKCDINIFFCRSESPCIFSSRNIGPRRGALFFRFECSARQRNSYIYAYPVSELKIIKTIKRRVRACLLYTSDAADE